MLVGKMNQVCMENCMERRGVIQSNRLRQGTMTQ